MADVDRLQVLLPIQVPIDLAIAVPAALADQAEGKIAEHWEQLDRLALMQQLGVIPAPAAPADLTG
jgi:hypothetical protein